MIPARGERLTSEFLGGEGMTGAEAIALTALIVSILQLIVAVVFGILNYLKKYENNRSY